MSLTYWSRAKGSSAYTRFNGYSRSCGTMRAGIPSNPPQFMRSVDQPVVAGERHLPAPGRGELRRGFKNARSGECRYWGRIGKTNSLLDRAPYPGGALTTAGGGRE